jgi:hypothetical protein
VNALTLALAAAGCVTTWLLIRALLNGPRDSPTTRTLDHWDETRHHSRYLEALKKASEK